ncbi:MAG TPA: VOC family protein [Bacillota bacterium]|nr:VOC family protein [Bacillota bacterium]
MNFCWVTIPVNDLEVSLEFYYGILGLTIDSRMSGGAILAFLGDKDKPKIELIQRVKKVEGKSSSPITIGIEVESLQEAILMLSQHGIELSRGPFSPNPHIEFAYVFDPDGYEVQLVEHK